MSTQQQQLGTNEPSSSTTGGATPSKPDTSGAGLLQFSDPVISKLCNMLMSTAPKVSKSWHSPGHSESRKLMQLCISKLILRKKPPTMGSYPEDTLFQVAEMIENRLYETAPSYDEYYNPSTLISRIKFLVINLLDEAKTEPPPAPREEEPAEEEAAVVVDEPEMDVDGAIAPIEANLNIYDSVEDGKKFLASDFMTAKAVSSQGCSRVFILKVLNKVNEYIQSNPVTSIFAMKRELVQKWLEEVKKECCNPNQEKEEVYFGGAPFVLEDSSTHWCESNQLFTWWKNNIERKTKFKVLQEDANYGGIDVRKCQRGRWCEAVVSLVAAIRSTLALSGPSRVVEKTPLPPSTTVVPVPTPATTQPPATSYSQPQEQQQQQQQQQHQQQQHQQQQRLPSLLGSSGQNILLSQNIPAAASFPFMGMVGMMNSNNILPAMNPAMSASNNSMDASLQSGKAFLLQLHDLLTKERQDIIVWEDDGLKFSIKDIMRFRAIVLPKYFQNMEYAPFLKTLAGYGFEVIDGEPGVLYHHPLFVRDRRELAANICELIPTTAPMMGSNMWPSQPVLPSLLGGASSSMGNFNPLTMPLQQASSSMPNLNNNMQNPFGTLPGMNNNTNNLLGGLSSVSNAFPYGLGGMGNFDWNALSQFGMGANNPMLQSALSQMMQNNFAMSYPFPMQYGGLGGFYPNMYGSLDNSNNMFNYGVQGMNNPPPSMPAPLPLSSTLSNIVNPLDGRDTDLKRKRESKEAKKSTQDESPDELVSTEEDVRGKRRGKKTIKAQELSNDAKVHIAKAFSHNLIQSALTKGGAHDSESEDGSLQSTDLEDEEGNAPRGKKRGRKPGPKPGQKRKVEPDAGLIASQNADDDVIDLRNPKNKRILMDFSAVQDDVKEEAGPKSVVSYVYGVFHGKVAPSKSSTAACVRRSKEHNANQPRIDPAVKQGLRVGRATIDPNQALDFKCSRVGEDYQAELPKLRSKASLSSEMAQGSEAVYMPSLVSEDDIEDIVVAYNNKHGYLPSQGDVAMVQMPDAENKRRFKLCAILEVLQSRKNASLVDVDLDTVRVRVYDGDNVVETVASSTFGPDRINEDQVLDLLHSNDYSVKKALHEVNKSTTRSSSKKSLSDSWTSGEVRRFCAAFKRHGENLRRIYQQSFFDVKEYAEIVEFFHHIQPFLDRTESDRVVDIFSRAEWAKKGFPDGEPAAEETVVSTEDSQPVVVASEPALVTHSDLQAKVEIESVATAGEDDNIEEVEQEKDRDSSESSVKRVSIANTVNTTTRRSSRGAPLETNRKGSGRESDVAEQSESSRRSSRSSDKEAKTKGAVEVKKRDQKPSSSNAKAAKESPPKVDSSIEEGSEEDDTATEKISVRTRAKRRQELPLKATEGHFGYLSVVEYDINALDKLNSRRKNVQEPEPRKLRRSGDGISSKFEPKNIRLCFCRKELDYGEKYIACNIGKKNVCNGWVHLWCVGLGRAQNDKLKRMKNFVCKECEENSSDESSEETA